MKNSLRFSSKPMNKIRRFVVQILQGDELLRALNMIQQFITAIDQNVRNAAAQNQTNQQDFKPNQLDYYKERLVSKLEFVAAICALFHESFYFQGYFGRIYFT